jgi:hypothetical protein
MFTPPPITGLGFSIVPSPKQADASVYRKSKIAAVKTEVAITFQRLEITTRFQIVPQHFEEIRLEYNTVDIPDFSKRWPSTEFKAAVAKTGSGNK